MCMVCTGTIALPLEYNVRRHEETKHHSFANVDLLHPILLLLYLLYTIILAREKF